MRAWVDGVLLDGREHDAGQRVSAPDARGVGDGVFTTVLVREGRALGWRRHLRRLGGSVRALGLGELDLDVVEEAARQAVGERGPGDRRLRLMVAAAAGGVPHLSVRSSQLAPAARTARVITPSVRRTSSAAVSSHKSSHYAENLMAAAEARRAGADEALLLTEVGHLSEGTGSNVFHVVDGELRTPSLSTGCLPGIAREMVMEWCEVHEVEDAAHVVQGAQEVFLTSSTREVQPVSEWGGRVFEAPGPVTLAVQATWRRALADPREWYSLA